MGQDLEAPQASLTDLITTEASLAMPDIVAIFISKYETELYDRKRNLQEQIRDIGKEMEDLTKSVAENMKYSEFIDCKMPKLGLESALDHEPVTNWKEGVTMVSIKIVSIEDDPRYRRPLMTRDYRKPISKSDINKFKKLGTKKDDLNNALVKILNDITDMSRKERQVKSRISEMRLQEQGMEAFITNPELLKLVQID